MAWLLVTGRTIRLAESQLFPDIWHLVPANCYKVYHKNVTFWKIINNFYEGAVAKQLHTQEADNLSDAVITGVFSTPYRLTLPVHTHTWLSRSLLIHISSITTHHVMTSYKSRDDVTWCTLMTSSLSSTRTHETWWSEDWSRGTRDCTWLEGGEWYWHGTRSQGQTGDLGVPGVSGIRLYPDSSLSL